MDGQAKAEAVILEHAPDAVIAIDAERRILSWNRGAEDIYGFSAAQAVGRNLLELTVPENRRGEARADFDALFSGTDRASCSFEGLRRRRDGLLIFVSTTVRRIPPGTDAGGMAAIVSDKDITRFRLQRDSKMLESRFRDLFELMPDAIVVLNATGRIVLVNTQAEELFGYPRGALLGEPVERLLPERLRTAHFAHRSDFSRHPRVRAMGIGLDLHGLRADGVEIPVDVSLSPLETTEGSLVLSAIRDATERRRLETMLRDRNTQLAGAMQAKDRFLATMSHELRTPLNAVIGFTGTLLMGLAGPLTEEQEKQLKTIRGSGRHLLSLINDLLDLARMDADKLDLAPERVDCREVLEEIHAALRPQSDAKNLSMILELPPARCIVTTDRRALTQILTNLAANAVKFCDRGSIRLSLRETRETDTRWVQMGVTDTGIGMKEDDVSTVFDAFSRLEAGRAAREGTGLGLHISKRLADRLGGRIEVESALGKGSVFTLSLPGD
ncbi:PAS domain-containing sensor histidine kinase [Aquabacter cavernae]|uniref:PAS domain-containing sensor histidine kinase n=1 Tax=Aquabacter cavernae TaxID=2496029 RepID=UPI000F8F3DE7|nr:PAS domain S-box protein [Aquabacter cavernae]